MLRINLLKIVLQRLKLLWNSVQPQLLKNISAKRYWANHKEIYVPLRVPVIFDNAVNNTNELKKILEFGCNNGVNLEYFINHLENISAVGIDVNPIVKKLESKYTNFRGYISDERILNKFKNNEFSLSFTSSVLDHIPEEKIVVNVLKDLANISECIILNEPFLEGVIGDVSEKYRYQVKAGLENPGKAFSKFSYFWNYDSYLENMGLQFKKIPNPLHKFSMGPFYYIYIINCSEYKI